MSLEDFDPTKHKRSSDFTFHLWDIVEPYLITCMGMSNFVRLYYNVDIDDIAISIENEKKKQIIPIVELANNINDFTYKDSNITYDVFLTIENKEEFSIIIEDCNYYYCHSEDNSDDCFNDGFIFLEAKINCSLQQITKIKHEFLKFLTKETQYALNDIIENIDIKNNKISDLDAKIEQLSIFSKIYDISIKESYEAYSEEIGFNIEEKFYVENLMKEGTIFNEKELQSPKNNGRS